MGGEVGFAAALDYMDAIGWDAMMAHEHALLERMLKGMASMPWLTVYGEPVADKRFGVVSFNVQDVHPHDVATILDAGGVASVRTPLCPAPDGFPGHRLLLPGKSCPLQHGRRRGRPTE